MSNPPWSSTTGMAHWFAVGPVPLPPGLSGTTGVWLHTVSARLPSLLGSTSSV